jgi:flagella basal body P-ring formation protein FlgA
MKHRVLVSILIAALPLLAAGQSDNAPQASDAAVRKAVDQYLRGQMRSMPGEASYQIDTIQTAALPPCERFSVAATPGARPWGRTSVTVRCIAGANWSLLVPLRIQVIGRYIGTGRGIGPGQTIVASDLVEQSGDLGELPAGVLTEPAQALGQVARTSLPAGRPLTSDLLRPPNLVQQGQSVRVVSRGNGFQVSSEGRALGNASQGQVVQVRLGNGLVVSGIAESSGIVEVGN